MSTINQSRTVRRLSVFLSFLLTFGVMTMLPTSAYAEEEYVCMIGDVGYTTIDRAVSRARFGDTIKLLTNTHTANRYEVWFYESSHSIGLACASLYIYSDTLTIDTNGFVLEVGKSYSLDPYGNFKGSTYNDYGLWVTQGGVLNLVDSSTEQTGQLVITADNAIRVEGIGSRATISSAIAVADNSVLARNGGAVTVTGDVSGGIDCTIRAESGGSVTVYGNVISDATAALTCSGECSIIEVKGDVIADSGCGVLAVGGAQVTVNGTITASDYVLLGDSLDSTIPFLKEHGVLSISRPGYYEYSDGNNYVFVTSDGSIKVGTPGSGDPFGRGTVDMDIPVIVARIVAGIGMTFTPAQIAAADMDYDGELTMVDVLLIMSKASEQ